MAGVVLEIALGDELSGALARLAAAGADLTPAMEDIAGHLEGETRDRFEEERDPLGVPWRPSRRVLGLDGSKDGHGPFQKDGQTLTLTGDLRSSIRSNAGRDFAEAGPEASGGAARYAAIHQFGGRITPKQGREGKDGKRPALNFGGRMVAAVVIPARPYLGWTDADTAYALDTLVGLFGRALDGGAPA